MATIKMTGLKELEAKLAALPVVLREKAIGEAVYEGARIMADTVRQELETVPTDNRFGTPENPTRGPKQLQLAALSDSLGITPMRDDKGFFNVKIGFDGYSNLKSKRWPKGQPNQMVARAVESGTSFMRANPFMKKAVSRGRREAEAAMKKIIDKAIDDAMK